jgi:hypothetical protein
MVRRKVHLVGSIAFDSVEELFRTAGTVLGHRLRRVRYRDRVRHGTLPNPGIGADAAPYSRGGFKRA